MNTTARSLFFILLLATSSIAQQKTPPVIGKPLQNVPLLLNYTNEGETSLDKLKGMPVLLDFFSKGCVACFRSFPKMNEFHKKYRDRVNIILIGVDYKDNVKKAYERFRQSQQLELPVAFDTILYKSFGMNSFPLLVWIGSDGIVQAITYTASDEMLESFAGGKITDPIDITAEGKKKQIPFDPDKPFLTQGNGGVDSVFLQRSLISRWQKGMANYTLNASVNGNQPLDNISSLQIVGRPLRELYRIAYLGRSMAWKPRDTIAYGNYHYGVDVRVRDSAQFDADIELGKNLYCYSQTLPPGKRTPERMMQVMQTDLKNCFGYDVYVETRMRPYLRLVASPGARKKLKVDPRKKVVEASMIDGGALNNTTMDNLVRFIEHAAQLSRSDMPLMDETGITDRIDIEINARMSDITDVARELRRYGMDIIRGQRPMKVLVIRDAPDHP